LVGALEHHADVSRACAPGLFDLEYLGGLIQKLKLEDRVEHSVDLHHRGGRYGAAGSLREGSRAAGRCLSPGERA
jgi:hypothetical protein